MTSLDPASYGAVEVPGTRELRRQVRDWRRARAELSVREVVEEAYVALLSALVLGAMAGNVVWGLRGLGDEACAGTCAAARGLVGWVVLPLVALACLGAARLLGPVFVAPAAGHWLLAAPVDRREALLPALRRALLWPLATGLLAVPVLVLAGLTARETTAVALATAAVAVAAVALAAASQQSDGPLARTATWVLALATWLLVGWVALAPGSLPADPPTTAVAAVAGALSLGATALLLARVVPGLSTTSRSTLARTQDAWPSLSGALASLDPRLLYDVLLSRRWAGAAAVRPVRRGLPGAWALLARELVRARRSPQPWLALAGLLVVPFALAGAGLTHGVVVATSLGGAVVLGLASTGLRVVARTPTLRRMLPLRDGTTRALHLVLPALGACVLGVATGLALAGPLPSAQAALLGGCTGLTALAASARWTTSPPPDYATPLVSTPAGGLPPGLVVSWARGLDVWGACSLAVLLDWRAGWAALVVAGASLAYSVVKG